MQVSEANVSWATLRPALASQVSGPGNASQVSGPGATLVPDRSELSEPPAAPPVLGFERPAPDAGSAVQDGMPNITGVTTFAGALFLCLRCFVGSRAC